MPTESDAMEVYIVTRGGQQGYYSIEAVFSTESAAEAYRAALPYAHECDARSWIVQESPLDDEALVQLFNETFQKERSQGKVRHMRQWLQQHGGYSTNHFNKLRKQYGWKNARKVTKY